MLFLYVFHCRSKEWFHTKIPRVFIVFLNTTDISKGKLCYKDTGYRLDNIPTCPVHGQYVIYHNERLSGVVYPGGYSEYAFNELCEVEVFGKSTTYKLVSLYFEGYPNMGKMISCVFPTCAYFIYQCNNTFETYLKQTALLCKSFVLPIEHLFI